MARIEKTVFISYRRTNLPWALTICQSLTHNGFDVFIDYEGIASGDFERVILENIRARAHFLLLLTPSALERCDTPGDWLRREIEEALETRRNVVPLMLEGFDFNAPAIASKLTGKLEVLKRYNGLTVPAGYFEAAMIKLRDKLLNVPLDAVLHPVSTFAQQAAKDQQAAAAAAPPVQQRELTAQEWFERGVNAVDLDQKIRYYTEALRLTPDDAKAYYGRGLARTKNRDFDGALKDYNEALRLAPDDVKAYYNRATVRTKNRDFDGALEDYTEALRLAPDDVETYFNRAIVRTKKGDFDGAIEDNTVAIRLKPDYAKPYYGRGLARDKMGDFDGAIEDYTEALRLKPDAAEAYCSRGLARYKKGDFDGAVKDYSDAILLKPNYVKAYNERSNVFKDKGDQEAAQRDLAMVNRLMNKRGKFHKR